MIDYFFCDLNNRIKKEYIEVCKFICSSTIKEHVWTGHNDEIINEYKCYTSYPVYFGHRTRVMRLFIEDVVRICGIFNVDFRYTSFLEVVGEFHGDNAEYMINTLKTLLKKGGGDSNVG